MAGGGRDGELMKFKASGGENLHAANGATFSSVPSASCQETGLIGLEELGRVGRMVGGVGRRVWPFEKLGSRRLLNSSTSARQQQANRQQLHSIGWFFKEGNKKCRGLLGCGWIETKK